MSLNRNHAMDVPQGNFLHAHKLYSLFVYAGHLWFSSKNVVLDQWIRHKVGQATKKTLTKKTMWHGWDEILIKPLLRRQCGVAYKENRSWEYNVGWVTEKTLNEKTICDKYWKNNVGRVTKRTLIAIVVEKTVYSTQTTHDGRFHRHNPFISYLCKHIKISSCMILNCFMAILI